MEDLKNIIKEIKGYQEELGLKFSDDQILETSVRIFNTQSIQNNKSNSRKEEPSQSVTKAQKLRLEKEGYTKEEINSLSKQDAWAIISKLGGRK